MSLRDDWEAAEAAPFVGWDFGFLAGVWKSEPLPWDYLALARTALWQSRAVLDQGTGGGERLLELKDAWPARVAATEGYPPNLALARERLGPLGVEVADADQSLSAAVPFGDASFDLVLNRHTGFNAGEVARVLTPGGALLTQQVDGRSQEDLLAEFGAAPPWPNATAEFFAGRVEAAGLRIRRLETFSGTETFLTVGAVVSYLRAVPWLVPGFSVAAFLPALERLQSRLEDRGRLDFTSRHYLIAAEKPA